jgi:hypothetical protein
MSVDQMIGCPLMNSAMHKLDTLLPSILDTAFKEAL